MDAILTWGLVGTLGGVVLAGVTCLFRSWSFDQRRAELGPPAGLERRWPYPKEDDR